MSWDGPPSIEWSLDRIADALERIADRDAAVIHIDGTLTETQAATLKARFLDAAHASTH